MHPNPAVSYRPLADAPPVPVFLAWRRPPTHPGVTDLLELVRAVLAAESATEET